MKRIQIKPAFRFQLIEKRRFWFGLLTFFLFSFLFYLFSVSLKEAIALFGLITQQEKWQVTNTQYYTINFFVAFLSLLFGSLFMLEIWFDRPVQTGAYCKRAVRGIIEEPRGVFWAVLYIVFALLVYTWVVFRSMNYHYCFDFINDYLYFPVLLVLFLFFNMWNRFVRLFKVSWKYIMGHFILVTLLALLFAFYVPSDFQRISEIVKNSQVANQYSFSIPLVRLKHPDRIEKKTLCIDIYILPKLDDPKKFVYIIDHDEVEYSELGDKINRQWSMFEIAERHLLNVRLFIDENVPMRAVGQVDYELFKRRIFRRYFVIKPRPNNCNSPSLGNVGIELLGFVRYIPDSLEFNVPNGGPPLPPIKPFYNQYFRKILWEDSTVFIVLDRSNSFRIEGETYLPDQLNAALKSYWSPRRRFALVHNDQTSYKDFLQAIGTLDNFIWDQRNMFSNQMFGQPYSQLIDREDMVQISGFVPYFVYLDQKNLERFKVEKEIND